MGGRAPSFFVVLIGEEYDREGFASNHILITVTCEKIIARI